jgi:hypothetical protein
MRWMTKPVSGKELLIACESSKNCSAKVFQPRGERLRTASPNLTRNLRTQTTTINNVQLGACP